MPTYDAETCKRLIDGATEPVGSRPWCDVYNLADALLAATQEVERLRIKPDWKGLRAEIERLRKLVGEACDLSDHFADVAGHPDDAVAIACRARIAAIRHAAGVEGKEQP